MKHIISQINNDENIDKENINNIKTQNNSQKNYENSIVRIISINFTKSDELEKQKDFKKVNDYQNNKNQKMVGFPNIGHSCYMNSFLQILFNTAEFLNLLRENYNNDKNQTLIKCLIYLSENKQNVYILQAIKNIMSEVDKNFGKNIQKDSQYFGNMLINKIICLLKKDINVDDNNNDKLEEEITIFNVEEQKNKRFNEYIKKYYNQKNETFLEKMFLFHESKIKLDKNELNTKLKIKKIDFESFLSVDLVFPNNQKTKYNIYDLLCAKYPSFPRFEKEVTNQQNNSNLIMNFINNIKTFSNNKNNRNININTNTACLRRLYSLPNILIITINRAVLGKTFNNSILEINERIDLKDYLDENKNEEEYTTYTLYGINVCAKYLENIGHYYSFVKIESKWFEFDDRKVSRIEPNLKSKNVVGLYYIRDKFDSFNNNNV